VEINFVGSVVDFVKLTYVSSDLHILYTSDGTLCEHKRRHRFNPMAQTVNNTMAQTVNNNMVQIATNSVSC
jgi:hypothetical protein